MSDSAKLRFCYGVILIVLTLITFGIGMALGISIFFHKIPSKFISLAIIFFLICLVFLSYSLFRFFESGYIAGKEEREEELKEELFDPVYREKFLSEVKEKYKAAIDDIN